MRSQTSNLAQSGWKLESYWTSLNHFQWHGGRLFYFNKRFSHTFHQIPILFKYKVTKIFEKHHTNWGTTRTDWLSLSGGSVQDVHSSSRRLVFNGRANIEMGFKTIQAQRVDWPASHLILTCETHKEQSNIQFRTFYQPSYKANHLYHKCNICNFSRTIRSYSEILKMTLPKLTVMEANS